MSVVLHRGVLIGGRVVNEEEKPLLGGDNRVLWDEA